MQKVLFVCTHNSARSQMAEGTLKALYGKRYEVHSAGTDPTEVHPMAVRVLDEIDIDISQNRTKHVDEFTDEKFDLIVTVCDYAKESCPIIPGGKKYMHKSFDDPSSAKGTEDEKLEYFKAIRDNIKIWIKESF